MYMNNQTKVAKLVNELLEGVTSFYSSEAWINMLTFQSRFHDYSWRNAMLIAMQCPDASYVAGFEEWKKMNRYVKLGEMGIKILAPIKKKVRDEETGQMEVRTTGYRQATVFDISQTGGEQLPTGEARELTMDTETLRGFYELLKKISPVPVEEVALVNGVKGYFDRENECIGIKKGMAALQKCKTLVHEMAHALLHMQKDRPREMREVEAEGTAFVVLSYFGFDTRQYSFPYVAEWNGSVESETIVSAASYIQKAACKLISMIEEGNAEKQSDSAA